MEKPPSFSSQSRSSITSSGSTVVPLKPIKRKVGRPPKSARVQKPTPAPNPALAPKPSPLSPQTSPSGNSVRLITRSSFRSIVQGREQEQCEKRQATATANGVTRGSSARKRSWEKSDPPQPSADKASTDSEDSLPIKRKLKRRKSVGVLDLLEEDDNDNSADTAGSFPVVLKINPTLLQKVSSKSSATPLVQKAAKVDTTPILSPESDVAPPPAVTDLPPPKPVDTPKVPAVVQNAPASEPILPPEDPVLEDRALEDPVLEDPVLKGSVLELVSPSHEPESRPATSEPALSSVHEPEPAVIKSLVTSASYSHEKQSSEQKTVQPSAESTASNHGAITAKKNQIKALENLIRKKSGTGMPITQVIYFNDTPRPLTTRRQKYVKGASKRIFGDRHDTVEEESRDSVARTPSPAVFLESTPMDATNIDGEPLAPEDYYDYLCSMAGKIKRAGKSLAYPYSPDTSPTTETFEKIKTGDNGSDLYNEFQRQPGGRVIRLDLDKLFPKNDLVNREKVDAVMAKLYASRWSDRHGSNGKERAKKLLEYQRNYLAQKSIAIKKEDADGVVADSTTDAETRKPQSDELEETVLRLSDEAVKRFSVELWLLNQTNRQSNPHNAKNINTRLEAASLPITLSSVPVVDKYLKKFPSHPEIGLPSAGKFEYLTSRKLQILDFGDVVHGRKWTSQIGLGSTGEQNTQSVSEIESSAIHINPSSPVPAVSQDTETSNPVSEHGSLSDLPLIHRFPFLIRNLPDAEVRAKAMEDCEIMASIPYLDIDPNDEENENSGIGDDSDTSLLKLLPVRRGRPCKYTTRPISHTQPNRIRKVAVRSVPEDDDEPVPKRSKRNTLT